MNPLDVLNQGEITVEGRVVAASNLTLYARVDAPGGATLPCVYKPVSGERPLWDFPDGTLAARERVAYLVSEAGGWHLVPPTVLRDGPLGLGMCQQWVTAGGADQPSGAWVDLVGGDSPIPRGWRPVVTGQDETGSRVTLVHRDEPALRDMAVLDVVLNNADRKGGHLLRADDGSLRGVDHGLCCHSEPKLRTVLWGWRGEPLTSVDSDRLARVSRWVDGNGEIGSLLTAREVDALRARVDRLGESGRLPGPSGSWPAIPWPAF